MAAIAVVLIPLMPRTLGRGGVIACLWLARFFIYSAYNLLWCAAVLSLPLSLSLPLLPCISLRVLRCLCDVPFAPAA